ncbi:MAG: succinate dehydrogenase cytochrome b558 subunit [Phycisphaerales bacterium]
MAQTFMDRHAFLLRRLHSLSGVVPIGVFMMIHLVTNASIMWGLVKGDKYEGMHAGAVTFQHEVDFIHSMPALLLIEIFGLWLPIAFHAILGAYYATKGRSNLSHYSRQNNWRYTLQRLTAWVGLVFIFWHVATLRWGWTFLLPEGVLWSAEYAGSTLAAVFQGLPVEAGVGMSPDEQVNAAGAVIVSGAYMLGVSALVFHLANGLWTAAITWGITLSAKAQQRWGYVCAAIGVGLMGLAWAAIIGFMTIDYDDALQAEQYLHDERAREAAEQMVGEPAKSGANDISVPVSYEDTTEGVDR